MGCWYMPSHPRTAITLRSGDRVELERLLGSSSVRTRMVQRAHLLLLAAEGVSTQEIADRVGVSRPTVNLWRSRYARSGLSGLTDRDRPGRPTRASRTAIRSGEADIAPSAPGQGRTEPA